MRELKLIPGLSHPDKIVFELAPTQSAENSILEDQGEGGERFFVYVTRELADIIVPPVIPSRQHNNSELKLGPIEIQARIRQGYSVEEVAEAAGVTPERIEPFTYPVIHELERMMDLAKAAQVSIESTKGLEDIIIDYFNAHHMDYGQAEWTIRKDNNRRWIVQLRWDENIGDDAVIDFNQPRHAHTDNPDALTEARWQFTPNRTGTDSVSSLNDAAKLLVSAVIPLPPTNLELTETQEKPATEQDHVQDNEEEAVDSFALQGPTEEPEHKKRRRKNRSSNWEDVVIGMRSKTKRPRNGE